MRKLGAIACTAFLFSVLSHGQIPTGGNVFFGYSYSRGDAFTSSFSVPSGLANPGLNLHGWDASVEGKYLPWLGVVADLDWHYGSRKISSACTGTGCTSVAPFTINANRYEVIFGPRASVSIGKYTPFAQVLLGFAHQRDTGGSTSNSDTSFASAFGGGLDYKLLKAVAVRAQVDVLRTRFFSGSQNHIRFSTGVVFRF